MKKSVLFLALFIMISFMFAGCNNTNKPEENTEPTSSYVVDATVLSTSAPAETATHNSENAQDEVTEPIYTAESDELEILTPNDQETTQNSYVSETEVTVATNAQSEETFPGLDSVIDEPIELPFVPIN